jgi:hypothetical protein
MDRLAWSIRELAQDGCVGKTSTIYEHMAAGRLQAYKLGRRTFVTDASVRKLMAAQPGWKPAGKPVAPRQAAPQPRH